MPSPSGWRKKVAISAAAFAAALAAAEVLLRTVWPVEYRHPREPLPTHVWLQVLHRPSAVPGLSYELRPGAVGDARGVSVRVDSHGLRGPEADDPKPPGRLRVAALGDSVTFGHAVEESQTWTSVLQELLTSPGAEGGPPAHAYDVLNFAVTGYSTAEEAVVLEHKALALDPDLIVVGYYLNDPDVHPIYALRMTFHEPEWWERSAVLRGIAGLVHQARIERLGGGDYYRWLHHPDTPEWRSVTDGFARMAGAARARGLRVLLVVFPSFRGYETWSAYPYRDLHAQVLRAAADAGFATLDLEPAFAASDLTPGELALDPEHPSPLGHALAARAIARHLIEHHAELFGVER